MPVSIRKALIQDVESIVFLAEQMHKISKYKVIDFNANKFRNFVTGSLDNEQSIFIVATKGEAVIGAILAFVADYVFSDALYCCDIGLYVDPKHRRSTAASQLIDAYKHTASALGVRPDQTSLGVTAGIESEKVGELYQRNGFFKAGELYTLES